MLAVFNIIAIIAQKIIIMEQNNTDIINLPKGSYVTLPKDEYMELQALKNKDYDFEKRVNEIKKDYEEKYDKFEKSKSVVVETTWNSGYIWSETSETNTLKVDGLKDELLEWLKQHFGIESIIKTKYSTRVSFFKDINPIESLTEYGEGILKEKDEEIKMKNNQIKTLEELVQTLETHLKYKKHKKHFCEFF